MAYLEQDEFSHQFLMSLPNHLDLPSPAMRLFVAASHFIGRQEHVVTVNQFGDSIARCNLSGGDFHRAHSAIHTTFRAMLCRAGFATTNDPASIFHGKVPEALIAAYLRLHLCKDAIIPIPLRTTFRPTQIVLVQDVWKQSLTSKPCESTGHPSTTVPNHSTPNNTTAPPITSSLPSARTTNAGRRSWTLPVRMTMGRTTSPRLSGPTSNPAGCTQSSLVPSAIPITRPVYLSASVPSLRLHAPRMPTSPH